MCRCQRLCTTKQGGASVQKVMGVQGLYQMRTTHDVKKKRLNINHRSQEVQEHQKSGEQQNSNKYSHVYCMFCKTTNFCAQIIFMNFVRSTDLLKLVLMKICRRYLSVVWCMISLASARKFTKSSLYEPGFLRIYGKCFVCKIKSFYSILCNYGSTLCRVFCTIIIVMIYTVWYVLLLLCAMSVVYSIVRKFIDKPVG